MFVPLTINKGMIRPFAALAFLCIAFLLPARIAAVRATSVTPPDISTGEKSEFLRLQQALLKYRAIASEGGVAVNFRESAAEKR